MSKKNTSDLVSAAGVFQGLVTNIMALVDEGLVSYDLVRKLSGDEGRAVLLRTLVVAGELSRVENLNKGTFDYFTPLVDTEVPAEHQTTLAKYRKLAEEHGVAASTPLCYRVRAGFTLKSHAPQTGHCYKDSQYLQCWKFEDKPTENCLIFWVPRLVKGSTSKSVDEQRQLLTDLRQHLELPDRHLTNFGEASLVAGLILAHFKTTGERVPLNTLYTRTDICYADRGRIHLGNFNGLGMRCEGLFLTDERCDSLGVFALGVELGS